MIKLRTNGEGQEFDGDTDIPLLWFLRDDAELKGAKYGCGIAQCGACTVHVNGVAVRSRVMPMASVAGADIVTIEGLVGRDDDLHPVQQAWAELDVPQCGYCRRGRSWRLSICLSAFQTRPTGRSKNSSLTFAVAAHTFAFKKPSIAQQNLNEKRGN